MKKINCWNQELKQAVTQYLENPNASRIKDVRRQLGWPVDDNYLGRLGVVLLLAFCQLNRPGVDHIIANLFLYGY